MTLGRLFWDSVEKTGDRPAQTWYDGETWQTRTYAEFGASVRDLAHALLSLGLKKGDRVALWSKNRPQWAEVDYANQSVGTVTVPVYDTLTGPQGAYILNDSGSKVLFVQDKELLDRVWGMRKDLKTVKTFVLMEGSVRREGVVSWSQLIKEGQDFAKGGDKVAARLARIKPEDLASFVYTSGTTGDPKGVMLSQENLASNAQVARTCVEVGPGDKFLSFLPLSHVFERTGGHFTPYTVGAEVVFARSIDTLVEDMSIHHPTLMMSVPRLYEKIYTRITTQVAKGSFLKRAIFGWAMEQGKAANVYRQRNEAIPKSLQKKLHRADKLVFHKLKQAVGGNLRYFVSGGAALSKEIEEFFWAAGIEILQGYGLTETSPVINVNRPGAIRFGSVGKAVPGAEVKIDTSEWESQRTDVVEGEICVRGPMVMQGYWKQDAATAEVFDKDGYFHTGDVGYLDEEGFLFITDRKKEIIVMSNGKNVAPQPIENRLKLQPHIEQACVIGDDRNYISALIQPDFAALEEFALANGIAGKNHELVSDQRVVSLIEKEVEEVNQGLSRYQQIKKFWVLPEAWSIETGELTPKMSIKRRIINDKFSKAIEKLYPKE